MGIKAARVLAGVMAFCLLALLCARGASAITADTVSPADSYTSLMGDETFSCNATDETALVNMTLHIWNTDSGPYYSNTSTVSGTSDVSNWTLSDIQPGNYVWNCIAYDSDSNGAWGTNRSLHANMFYQYDATVLSDNTRSVAVGDLDNDGYLDFIAGNSNQPNRVYVNNGTGGFDLSWSSTETDNTQSIAIADLDNDGYLDFISGNFAGANRIYINDGTGSFTLHENDTETGDEQTYSVTISDFDLDSDLDYAVANVGGNGEPGIQVYVNDGQAHFTSYQNISPSSYSMYTIASGDLTGDRYPDLAGGGAPFQMVRVLPNNGSGWFGSLWTASPNSLYIRDISFSDINKDGSLDMIQSPDRNFQANRVMINNGTGGFTLASAFGTTNETYAFPLADFDNDGYVDGISGNYDQNNYIFVNNGTSYFLPFERSPLSARTISVAVGDFDNDGDMDYVTGNSNTLNRVYLNRLNNNDYVEVTLKCNRVTVSGDCIGSTINVTQAGSPVSFTEVFSSGPTYGGPSRVHLGIPSGSTYTLNATLPTGKVVSCSVQPPKIFTLYDNATATGGVSCYTEDAPPQVTFTTPLHGSILTPGTVNFTCYGTDDNGLVNITLLVWNGTGLVNESTEAATGLSGYSVWSLNMSSTGVYRWNCMACDIFSKCALKPTNNTLSIIDSLRLRLRLVLNGTEGKVYVPGAGEANASEGQYQESSPLHNYVAAYNERVLSGLVFSGWVPRLIEAMNGSGEHQISISQNFDRSMALLVFTGGDYSAIENRMTIIEAGEFLSAATPSFSYGLGGAMLLNLALHYGDIDLEGAFRAHRGTHRLVIENNGTSSGRPSVSVSLG